MKSINLISRDNGVGLSTDMHLLEYLLEPAGYAVRRVDWREPRPPAADLAIHLELLNPAMVRAHRWNVGIFNPEWFQPKWRYYLPQFRQLWTKSAECEALFRRWGLRNVHRTGFLGRDMYDPAVDRQPTVLHLAGHSSHKNTDAVLAAWRDNPDLPPLTVISHTPREVPANVRLERFLDQAALRIELNRAQIHLCPSRTEGWGHYIVEAASTANLVITTDASPMNEHITAECGILIRPLSVGRTHQAATYTMHPDRIADAVRAAALLPEATREKMGQAARQRFLQRNTQFGQTALDLLRRF